MRFPRALRSGLWRSPNFVRLWAGQTVSLLGSYVGGGAVRFAAILLLGAGPAELGLLTAAGLLPALLLALPAGAWADRVRRRPLLIAADLGRALLLLALPAAHLLGALRVELLYVVAALSAALTILFDTAYHAFLPSVVARGQLTEGNSKLAVSSSLAEVAGPPLGGIAVQAVGAPLAVLADSLSFAISALAIWRVDSPEAPAEPSEGQAVWRDVAEGLRAAVGEPRLVALLASSVVSALGGGVIGSLYDVFLLRDLGLSPAVIGLTVGAGGVSAVAGAVLAERAVGRLGVGPALLVSRSVGAAAAFLLPLASGPWAAALVFAAQLTDAAYAIYAVGEVSLRQSAVPERLLGRVGACFALAPTAAALVGALATGPLAAALGVRGALLCGAAAGLLSAAIVAAPPLLRTRALGD